MPGVYQVREVQPVDYFSVGATPGTVAGDPVGHAVADDPDMLTEIVIPLGDLDAVDYDFAEARAAAISGYVYHDASDDGNRDAGEEGIAGIAVRLIPVDTVAAQNTATAVTDAAGHYRVEGLAAWHVSGDPTRSAGKLF